MTRRMELVTGLDQSGAQQGTHEVSAGLEEGLFPRQGQEEGPWREHVAFGGLAAAGSCCGHGEGVELEEAPTATAW